MPTRFLDKHSPRGEGLALPDVTLVAVSSVAIPATVRALRISQRGLRFGASLLLSDRAPTENIGTVDWRRIEPIRSREEYSGFMLTQLHAHIETSHALCVQWDGYVLDPQRWDSGFLDYDYIGAPWPHFPDGYRVGNGGFSLRSRRLLAACAEMGLTGDLEDVAICRTHRAQLEKRFGLVFAPEEIALRFAWASTASRGDEFGFHGAFNLVKHASDDEVLQLFQQLEPELLHMREHGELLRWALRHARWRLARVIWRRMRRGAARL